MAASQPETDLRGLIDLELDGQSFVLRPSYEAIVAIEAQTGQQLVPLAVAAGEMALDQTVAGIIVAEFIKAQGRATGAPSLIGVNAERVGQLIYAAGTMNVLPRIAVLLSMAASGGCLPSGELKATEMTIPEIPVAASQDSPRPPSAGRRRNSGKARQ